MPLSPDARRALEALNRRPLKHADEVRTPPAGTDEPAVRGPGRRAPAAPAPPPELPREVAAAPAPDAWEAPEVCLAPGEMPALERLVPGVVLESETGSCYLRERPVPIVSGGASLAARLMELFARGPASPGHAMSPLLSGPPEAMLLLDIETCGLSGVPLFMVGVLYLENGELAARQFFARHYGEEPAVLAQAHDLLRGRPGLATFNGRTFDIPYIANRSVAHRLPPLRQHLHVDLLQLARGRWRGRLPDCRLQTLERHICGRQRVDDIPGEMMGQVYHDFVRTGDATRIAKVFHHNLMDLVTMAELLCHLAPGGHRRPR